MIRIFMICYKKAYIPYFIDNRSEVIMSKNSICHECGNKMKQQFIGLKHCRCGIGWMKSIGFFTRTPDMIFYLKK